MGGSVNPYISKSTERLALELIAEYEARGCDDAWAETRNAYSANYLREYAAEKAREQKRLRAAGLIPDGTLLSAPGVEA
jgi:hypothetical protein